MNVKSENNDRIMIDAIMLYTNIERKNSQKLLYSIMIFSFLLALLAFIMPLLFTNVHLSFIVLGLLFFGTFSVCITMIINNRTFTRYMWSFWLIIYLILLCFSVSFTYLLNRDMGTSFYYDFNFIPFKSIFYNFKIVLNGSQNIMSIYYYVIRKIIIMIPLPILLVGVSKRNFSFKKIIVIGMIISLLREFVQLITKFGIFDIDDIILNLVGCIIGYFIILFLDKKRYFSVK